MVFARFILVSTLLLGALAISPADALASGASGSAQGDAARAGLVAERQRVRAELERANAEVDALKRSSRGMREDYRLRERLADAEALARRLTELDARLGTGAPPAAHGASAEPRITAADGPAELEAKADILADQAQRLATRGDALLGRARDLRARQTLRRRVGQMERDPFSPLEGSKRRAMTGTATTGFTAVAGAPTGGTRGPSPTGATAGANDKPVTGTPDQVTAAGVNVLGPPSAPNTAVGGPTVGQAVASPTTAPSPTSATEAGGALSAQLRDLLDPTTLAEIAHLESVSGAGTSFEAMERAGAALKARADRLRQQAAALRASEHAPPRSR